MSFEEMATQAQILKVSEDDMKLCCLSVGELLCAYIKPPHYLGIQNMVHIVVEYDAEHDPGATKPMLVSAHYQWGMEPGVSAYDHLIAESSEGDTHVLISPESRCN